MGPTLTQNIFACCLCLFGPGFGFWGAYICRHTRLGAIWGFVIAAFIAYAGWFISGLVALNLYPHYGPALVIRRSPSPSSLQSLVSSRASSALPRSGGSRGLPLLEAQAVALPGLGRQPNPGLEWLWPLASGRGLG